jgi:hypothetical protein
MRDYALPAGTEVLTTADIGERYPTGSIVNGHVTSATNFGVFIEIDNHPQVPQVLVHKSQIGPGALLNPSTLFPRGLEVRLVIDSHEAEEGHLKISGAMPGFSLASVARPETRVPLSAGWKRYLRSAAAAELSARSECAIEIGDRELVVRAADVERAREALRELDDVFARNLALVEIPAGAMGRLIGKERRGLRELEERFGVRTAPHTSDAIIGGPSRELIEAAIAHLRQRPKLAATTFSWLPADGTLPRRR